MAQFQQMMTHFLDTQRSVMTAYLQGAPGDVATDWTPQSVATAWPEPILAPLPSAPATPQNGVSAIAVEEVEALPPAVPAAPQHQDNGLPDREQLTSRLLAIVSERTGYPTEMLNLDQDLEADLGIDSIKRVEILGNFQQSFSSNGNNTEELMEKLATVKTLGGIIEWVTDRVDAPTEPRRRDPHLPEQEKWEVPLEELNAGAAEPSDPDPSLEDGTVQRYVLTPVETP